MGPKGQKFQASTLMKRKNAGTTHCSSTQNVPATLFVSRRASVGTLKHARTSVPSAFLAVGTEVAVTVADEIDGAFAVWVVGCGRGARRRVSCAAIIRGRRVQAVVPEDAAGDVAIPVAGVLAAADKARAR